MIFYWLHKVFPLHGCSLKSSETQTTIKVFFSYKTTEASVVWFSNGPYHSKTEQNGRHFFYSIRKPNFETFGIRMDSVFERSVFEPPLYVFCLT